MHDPFLVELNRPHTEAIDELGIDHRGDLAESIEPVEYVRRLDSKLSADLYILAA